MHKDKIIDCIPVSNYLAAVSVGIGKYGPILDLCYEEDHIALVDMNIVMTDKGEFVEVQGTGENATFSRTELNTLMDLAEKGNKELFERQREALGETANLIGIKR